MTLGEKKCREGLNVGMNYAFNLLHHVDVVAKRVRRRRRRRRRRNTPSGTTGRGVKTVIMAMGTVCIYRLQGLDVFKSSFFFKVIYTKRYTKS